MPTFTEKLSTLINDGFDFGLTSEDYPIFDETYRSGLNKKILDHYWNYEIGQETEGMFRFSLNRKMREIMPYYNQLYLSEKLTFDPLSTVNLHDLGTLNSTDNGTSNQSTNTTSDTESKGRVVNSTTPQVLLSPNEDYASAATNSISSADTTGSGTTESTHNNTNENSSTRTVTGSQGFPTAELLMRYRNTMLNIDMMVISDLSELFMQIWDNGDEYTKRGYFGDTFGLNWIL